MIYLDNAATTTISPQVFNKMYPWLKNSGNAGGLYTRGREAREAIENARKQVAELINCEPNQIIFTSGGSESNNMVMRMFRAERAAVSSVEHDSILNAVFAKKEREHEYVGDKYLIPVNTSGVCTLADCKEVLYKGFPRLVSVMYANNEVNARNPVEDIAKEVHAWGKERFFHTDCVQALGYYDVDMQKIGCDFASFSSHKIHGPQGVGALYVKDKKTIHPLIYGSEQQEFGLRAGTENVAGIVGFGEACRLAKKHRIRNIESIKLQKEAFMMALLESIADDKSVGLNGDYDGKLLSLRFPKVDGQSLVLMLAKDNVCVSTGSACNSYSTTPSHVLTAIGLSDEDARSTIRVSFDGNEGDGEHAKMKAAIAGKLMAEAVNSLRGV